MYVVPFQNMTVEIMILMIANQSTTMLSTMEICTTSIIDVLQRVAPNPFEQDAHFAVTMMTMMKIMIPPY